MGKKTSHCYDKDKNTKNFHFLYNLKNSTMSFNCLFYVSYYWTQVPLYNNRLLIKFGSFLVDKNEMDTENNFKKKRRNFFIL